MIIIRLKGGLGNQMFQYAFGKSIAKKLGVDMKLDLTSLLQTHNKDTNREYQMDIFNCEDSFLLQPNLIRLLNKLHLNFLTQIVKAIKLLGFKKYKEKTFNVQEAIINNPKDNYVYVGYWQSKKYFKNIETELRNDFQFKGELSSQAESVFDAITKVNAVCVHVRRGDYVANTAAFNCSDNDYFISGAKYIVKNTNNPHFFVFSDDPEWCKENIKFDCDFTIVDYKTDKIKYKEDLQLMASCNHFIMSASSFSWWAVWLSNKKEAKVVVPKNWYLDKSIDVSDLVDENWIKL